MTGYTNVESLCKYSPWIKTEPHHLAVRGCHLHHFVKPGLPHLSDIISNKLLSNISLLCHRTVKWMCLVWCLTLLPLPYYHLPMFSEMFYLIFWGKTVNLGLKIRLTLSRMKEWELFAQEQNQCKLSLKRNISALLFTVCTHYWKSHFRTSLIIILLKGWPLQM